MPTESDNFKFLLFFYPISSHDFLRMGLSIGWGVVLCNELSVHVVQMVIALNHKEHVYTRGRHHKIVLFVLYNERLSSARSIFRNDFALEFWRPLTSTYFELDFVYHVPKVPSFPFPTVKDPNFCKDLAQQHFQKQRPFPRNLFSFSMNVQVGLSIPKAGERRVPSPGNYGSLSRQFLMHCNLW